MPKTVPMILGILAVTASLVIICSFIANTLFSQRVNTEVTALFSNKVQNETKNETAIITKADLEGLPECVRSWLEGSGTIGKQRINTVRLKQTGFMRTKKGQSWMPVEAEQYFTTTEPGFIWKAKIKAAPFIHIAGRDKYYEGRGNMLIKPLSFITLADAKGEEINQGTLVRYLSEIVWFPTAALEDYILWEEIDADSAKAHMNYKGITASGVFTFNEKGEVIKFTAERFRESDGSYTMETWAIPMKDHKVFEGIKVPTGAEVIWKLKTGDFSWYKLKITEVEYNKPTLY